MRRRTPKSRRDGPNQLIAAADRLEAEARWPEAVSAWQHLVQLAIRSEGEHSDAAGQMYFRLAMALYQAGETTRAAATMYHSWKLLRRPLDFRDDVTEAVYHGASGLLLRTGQDAQMADVMEEALPAMVAARGDSADTLVVRGNLGEMLRRMHEYDRAERYLHEAVAQAEAQPRTDAPALSSLHNNLGLLYRDTDRPAEAEAHCRKSVTYARRTGDPQQLAVSLDNHGSCLLETGDLAAARDVLLEAMARSRDVFAPHSDDALSIRLNLASAMSRLGQPAEARNVLREGVEAGTGNSSTTMDTLLRLISVNLELGDAGEATRVVRDIADRVSRPDVPLSLVFELDDKIAALFRTAEVDLDVSVAGAGQDLFDGLVRRYRAQVNTMQFHAEERERRVLDSAQAVGVRPRVSMIETMAVRQLITEQSIRFAQFIGDRDTPLADVFRAPDESDVVTRARIHAALGQWEQGLAVLAGTIDEDRRDVDPSLWLTACFTEAELLLGASRFEAALEKCEALCRHAGSMAPQALVQVLQLAAQAFEEIGNRPKHFAALLGALSCLGLPRAVDEWTAHYLELQVRPLLDPDVRQEVVSDKIRTIWEYLGLPLDDSITPDVYQASRPDPVDFGRVVLLLRNDIQLRVTEHINVDLMQRGAMAFEAALDLVNASRLWLTLAEDFLEGGNDLAFQGCLARAQRLLQGKPGEPWFDVRRLEARAAHLAGDRASAIRCLSQALDVAETVRTSLSSPEDRRNYFGHVADAARTLVALLLADGREHEAWVAAERTNARSLLDTVAGLAARPGTGSPGSGTHDVSRVIDLDRVLRAVQEGEALVAPVLVPDGVAAFVVRQGLLSVHRWSADHDIIAAGMGRLRALLEPGVTDPTGDDGIRRCGGELFELLFGPLSQALRGVRQLIWVPEYALHSLPIECLHDGDQFLVHRYSVVNCSSGSVLAQMREDAGVGASTPRPRRALVVGDPLGDLPQALEECRSVSGLLTDEDWQVTRLLGPDATWSAVAPGLSVAGLVHLACHGTFNPAFPERSYVQLRPDDATTDGKLTMDRLAGVRLRGSLVVMTSCHTGASRVQGGNEMSGFVRRLIECGAQDVVAPLWEVGDDVARALMAEFYPLLLAGRRPAEALQAAKVRLIRHDKYSSPRHWAPVQLFGVDAVW